MGVRNETEESERGRALNESEPVLYVDVNLGSGVSKRITVFEGDTAEQLAKKFSDDHCEWEGNDVGLDENTRDKLTNLLQSQMNQLLTKIEEGESEDYES